MVYNPNNGDMYNAMIAGCAAGMMARRQDMGTVAIHYDSIASAAQAFAQEVDTRLGAIAGNEIPADAAIGLSLAMATWIDRQSVDVTVVDYQSLADAFIAQYTQIRTKIFIAPP